MRRFFVGAFLFFGSHSFGVCQPSPPGTQGQDWDQKTVVIRNKTEVVINGQVTTKNVKSGNTSSIILFIDGVERRRNGGDRAQTTITYRYSEDGRHTVTVQCGNTQADADTCTLNVSRSEIETFE